MGVEWIGLDADDTLWHSEGHFSDAQRLFTELLTPYANGTDLGAHLGEVELRNLALLGYGVKAFTLSMVEAAVEVSDGRVPADVIATLVARGKEMLNHPVELLDGVAETVIELSTTYRLVVITKGDLAHQERKLACSGLAEHVEVVEIVSEKDVTTYQRVLDRHGIDCRRFVMVGNAIRSDVLPVIAIGGRAVHIPYVETWAHEHVEHDHDVPTLTSIRELPGWLARHG